MLEHNLTTLSNVRFKMTFMVYTFAETSSAPHIFQTRHFTTF